MIDKIIQIDRNQIVYGKFALTIEEDRLGVALAQSVSKYGQLYPLIVREKGSNYEIVDGRRLLRALALNDISTVTAVNLGLISDEEADCVKLSLRDVRFKTDHLHVAQVVKKLLDIYPQQKLSTLVPYGIEELKELADLANYDWEKTFKKFTHKEKDMSSMFDNLDG